jgi:hypothetical protein
MNFSMMHPQESTIRACFQSFLANIAPTFELLQQKYKPPFFCSVLSDLFLSPAVFAEYNRRLYANAFYIPSDAQEFRECQSNSEKASILSEKLLIGLLDLATPVPADQVSKLVAALESTQFKALAFVLYDKSKDYIKCLQILVRNSLAKEETPAQEDLFAWILKIYCWYESTCDDGFQSFQMELQQSIPSLI